MTLRPYQQEGVAFLALSDRAVLGDAPGLGKTPQAIEAARIVSAKWIVVICPAVAVTNWAREFGVWWPTANYSIWSYDKVAKDHRVQEHIKEHKPDVLILDEAHFLKNPDSVRTRAIYSPKDPSKGVAAAAKRVWALSGTLAPNHAAEYWTHLRVLIPDLLASYDPTNLKYMGFIRRYTKWKAGEYDIQVLGLQAGKRAEFGTLLKRVGLRREVEEVLPDLPEMTVSMYALPADCITPELERMESSEEVQILRRQMDEVGDLLPDTVHLATLRRLTAEVKAAASVTVLWDWLESGAVDKLVVWAQHTSAIDLLRVGLADFGAVVIDGRVPQGKRGDLVHEFQTGKPRVFIGQLDAASTAITLTRANHEWFVESSWTPDTNEQAAKRCHRIGQKSPVFVRVAYLPGSVDELVQSVLTRKLKAKVQIGD